MVTVPVRGINKVTVTKRGKRYVYYYVRATGKRVADEAGRPLTPDMPGFVQAVERMQGAETKPAPKAAAVAPRSLAALIDAYRGNAGYGVDGSPEWKRLRPRTRKDYGRVLDWLAGGGAMPIKAIDGPFVVDLRDKAFNEHGWRFANYVVQVASILCGWGMLRQPFASVLPVNPAAGVPQLKRATDAQEANRPWTPEERATVLAHATGGIRVGIGIGCYSGLREADVVACMRSRYRNGEFLIHQAKTGEPLWIPAHPKLRAILAEAPANSTHLVTKASGQPYTQEGFKTGFFRLIRKLEKAGKVEPGLTFHGLRHTLGDVLADLGFDPRAIADVLGQRTTKMGEHYSRRAKRKQVIKLAAKRLERSMK